MHKYLYSELRKESYLMNCCARQTVQDVLGAQVIVRKGFKDGYSSLDTFPHLYEIFLQLGGKL